MQIDTSPLRPYPEAERLIRALHGVLSVRVLVDGLQQLREIHVLAAAHLHPKQVVRNIESALSAGLDETVDRRIISVAQSRLGRLPGPEEPAEHTPRVRERLVFETYDARSQPNADCTCQVTLRRGETRFGGSGAGPGTPSGRAQAAARAVFAALAAARDNDDVGLEGAALVEAGGRTWVMVSALALEGRDSATLTGVAELSRSPEEAAILAALQACNRWTGTDA
ncbi:MAG: hypothetical protein WEB88_08570 [Gemmatimonadota bacterium]